MSSPKYRLIISTFFPHFLVHAIISSLPIFVPLWLAEFEVTRMTIGTVMGALYIFYGGVAIPVGILADRFGSIRFLEVFLFGTAAAAVFMGITTSFLGLVLALLGIGLVGGLYHPPAFRLLSRQTYTSSSLFAYHNVGGNLGLGIGPIITAILLTYVNWRATMLIAGGIMAVVGVLFVWFGPTNSVPDPDTGARNERVSDRISVLFTVGFVFVLVLYLLRGISYRGAVVFIPDYLSTVYTVGSIGLLGREIPPSRWVYSMMLMVGVGGQLVGGYVDEHVDTTLLIALQLLLTSAILAVLGRTTGLVLFGVVALFGFSMMFLSPILQNFVAKHTPEHTRGLGYGFTSAVSWAAGGFLGALLAGWLATIGSYSRMFSILALIPLVTVGVVLVYAVRFRGT